MGEWVACVQTPPPSSQEKSEGRRKVCTQTREGGELWKLNVPVKNNANRFSLQKALSIPFHGRRMNLHYGGLVDLKSKKFHITSSTCALITDLNELTCMQMRYTRPLKL